MRTRTPGSATAGSPIATSREIRSVPAAAYQSASIPPSEWPTTGASSSPSASKMSSISSPAR